MKPSVSEYDKCRNPLCKRWVRRSVDYCCGPCRLAHEGGYEVHSDGELAHTEGCDDRFKERGRWPNTEGFR